MATRTLRAAATASARTWCTKGANAFAADGAGSGDGVGSAGVDPGNGVELVDAAASGDEVEPGSDGPGVDGSDVLPGVLGDAAPDSAAAVGLVLLLPSLTAPFVEGGRWVALVVRDALVDGAVRASPDFRVVCDGPLEAPSVEARGPGFVAEPAPLLDEDGLVELSGPVLSAWATPDPLARAAPTPSVIAPAPSQPCATRRSGLARCRPFARWELPRAAEFARCPPATPAPSELDAVRTYISVPAKVQDPCANADGEPGGRAVHPTSRSLAQSSQQFRSLPSIPVVTESSAANGTSNSVAHGIVVHLHRKNPLRRRRRNHDGNRLVNGA